MLFVDRVSLLEGESFGPRSTRGSSLSGGRGLEGDTKSKRCSSVSTYDAGGPGFLLPVSHSVTPVSTCDGELVSRPRPATLRHIRTSAIRTKARGPCTGSPSGDGPCPPAGDRVSFQNTEQSITSSTTVTGLFLAPRHELSLRLAKHFGLQLQYYYSMYSMVYY